MNHLLKIFTICFLSISCFSNSVKDYPINNKEFIIIVLLDDDMNVMEAKQKGLERASEITKNKGYRYFIIQEQRKVMFMGVERDDEGGYDFPRNIYQEDIIERGMGREYIEKDEDIIESPALRLIIEILDKEEEDSVDACDYVKCK